ncbi:hypothetical protein GCM10009409_04620 [Shewanella saliphila]|uniref:Uncharacterized protein n=1 Tax=Shewanella saliphila TaxID=2282698 RepID=A0ABQ2Q1F8_9GAMM|nr:hypothetical protein GCM10009409_04620 [Shewanella saliphila]
MIGFTQGLKTKIAELELLRVNKEQQHADELAQLQHKISQ